MQLWIKHWLQRSSVWNLLLEKLLKLTFRRAWISKCHWILGCFIRSNGSHNSSSISNLLRFLSFSCSHSSSSSSMLMLLQNWNQTNNLKHCKNTIESKSKGAAFGSVLSSLTSVNCLKSNISMFLDTYSIYTSRIVILVTSSNIMTFMWSVGLFQWEN